MILDLDVGNSRIKWRVGETGGQPVASGSVPAVDDLFTPPLAQFDIQRARIACVRGSELLAGLENSLEARWKLVPEVARVSRHCQGVSVAYADLNRLGVDRWLAMLAAYRTASGPVVVVDCGTALTVDLVAAHGDHLGGYIVPGLRLGTTALTGNTTIRLAAQPDWGLDPGQSTEDAIYHGSLMMLVSLIEAVIRRERAGLFRSAAPVVLLTGGDAGLIKQFVDAARLEVRVVPDLVLDGLALALP